MHGGRRNLEIQSPAIPATRGSAGARDARLLAVAAGSDGVITLGQLTSLGLSRTAVGRRVSNGLLTRACRGIYLVPALKGSTTALRASLLSLPVGDGRPFAVAGFESAAWLYGLIPEPREHHCLVHHGTHRRFAEVRLHQTRQLEAIDVGAVAGIGQGSATDGPGCWPATTPARTLCDLAAQQHPLRVRDLIEKALLAGVLEIEELVACHQSRARRGVPGIRTMRRALGGLVSTKDMAASPLERRLIQSLQKATNIELKAQFRPPWYDGVRGIVDLADPIGKTVIEADGRQWHSTTAAFENDRARDRRAAANGWLVIRVGWRELTHRHDDTINEIITVLDSRTPKPHSGVAG